MLTAIWTQIKQLFTQPLPPVALKPEPPELYRFRYVAGEWWVFTPDNVRLLSCGDDGARAERFAKTLNENAAIALASHKSEREQSCTMASERL